MGPSGLSYLLDRTLLEPVPSAKAVIPDASSVSRLAISFPLARYRGPGRSPLLIASLITTSERSLAEAAP